MFITSSKVRGSKFNLSEFANFKYSLFKKSVVFINAKSNFGHI